MTIEKGPEFSRAVAIADLTGGEIRIDAEADERAALARRFGLVALDSLDAMVHLIAKEGGGVQLRGTLRADVTQSCVVTLQPVHSFIEASFDRHYAQTEKTGTPEEEDSRSMAKIRPNRWSTTSSISARPSPSNWLWRSTPFRDPRKLPSTVTSAVPQIPETRRRHRVLSRP